MVKYLFYRFFSRLYRAIFFDAGAGTFISIRAELFGKNIVIGRDCRILMNSKMDTSSNPSNARYIKRTIKGRIDIGDRVTIKEYVMLMSYDGFIKIGDNCSINPYTIIYGHGGVTIGQNVMIASNSIIVSANHDFGSLNLPISKQGLTCKGVCIEDDVWIGSNVKILDGVTVRQGCVIAAGSVVTKSTDSFGVYAGIPAAFLKKRGGEEL